MNIADHRHYYRWMNAKARCYNPSHKDYKNYGARGITMSDEFRNNSRAFCEYLDTIPGFGPGMSMDRTDNDKGYERGNFRWATRSEQNLNQRERKRRIKRWGRGITFNKKARKWAAVWRVGKKICYYGWFKTKEEAIARAIETCSGVYPGTKPSQHRTKREEYTVWRNIKQRCCNPKHPAFSNYGGRGIKIYEPWLDSKNFIDYCDVVLGPKPVGHSIDRIDNNLGYIPGNLKWSSHSEQQSNRRSYGKGYSWSNTGSYFVVQWNIGGTITRFGTYPTEAEAKERARATCPQGPDNYAH